MELDEDGRVDGKIPIFSDVLAFLWNKMKCCTRDQLLNVLDEHFKAEDIITSRDILYRKLDSDKRPVRHRNKSDILKGLYDVLQGLTIPAPFLFVALNLNKLPCLDLKNIDSVNLLCEQKIMKNNLEQLMSEQIAIKAQLNELVLKNNKGAHQRCE